MLKGTLAPVYDTAKKKHFASVFPSAAKGKYDVYGLFMERSLQLLKKGGRFALLTQDTYLDKEWAKGLRKLLSEQTRLETIVDLNPFGQLFFKAMNAPCLTVTENTEEAVDGYCLGVTTNNPKDNLFRKMKVQQRRAKVAETVQQAISELASKKRTEKNFSAGARIALATLRRTASDRWDLSGQASQEDFPEGWFSAAELLEMRQGVTPGGFLETFLMEENKAKLLELEDDLVHNAIKSKQLKRWKADWKGQVLLYPYHVKGKKAEPAFSIDWDNIKDQKLKNKLLQIKIKDALDYDSHIDSWELDIIRQHGISKESAQRLLKHRVSLGLVPYPNTAAYLTEHYEDLHGRVFEKKKFTAGGKRWYEYHRPRDPKLMLSSTRILSPTLIREVRFVLDTKGYLSDHACLMIQPAKKPSRGWLDFSEQIQDVIGNADRKSLLRYCLAFMNSQYAQKRLTTGHRPTPKGSYAITKAFMKEIPIPRPSKKMAAPIIQLVTELEQENDNEEISLKEDKLEKLVQAAMKAAE